MKHVNAPVFRVSISVSALTLCATSDPVTIRHMEPDLAPLGRLWPNREHESNWLKDLICAAGFHRWHTLRFEGAAFDFCRWCPEIRRPAPHSKGQTKQD